MCDNTRSAEVVLVEAQLIIVLMGVAGSGKTTVGSLLAHELGWRFADADDFHPSANRDKISRGIALTDSDRAPWLAAMRSAILQWNAAGENVVLACSALKRCYRDELRLGDVRFVFLRADSAVLRERLRLRHGHFADEKILASQLATLEEPGVDEQVIAIDTNLVGVNIGPEEIASVIIAELKRQAIVS